MQALENFDEFVLETLNNWQVPGIAIGVIKDQSVILRKGYGYSDLARGKTITSQTCFQLASITKSFTATAAAILVDLGKLNWDTPVRQYLPEFQLSDALISDKITPRDLLAHLTGLPRHDMLWMLTGYSREEVFNRLKHLQFSADLRQRWQYNNLMYMVAGYLTGRLTNTSWEDFIRQQIFLPLGMHETHFLRERENIGDMARPYYLEKGQHRIATLEWDARNSCAPAGHIISNIDDMLHYLKLHMNLGKHGEQRLVSEENCKTIQSPQAIIDDPDTFEEIGPVSTCLGFQTSTYRGNRYIHHDGSSIGYATRMSFMPEKKFGFILLSNMLGFNDENPVPWLIARNLEDRLLGLEPIDWHSRLNKKFEQNRSMQLELKKQNEDSVVKGTQPSHALNQYIGTYEHPAYGRINIKKSANSAAIFSWDLNGVESTLSHHHYDSFASPRDLPYVVDPLGSRILTFHANDNGDIDRLTTSMEPGLDDATFHRIANASARLGKPFTKPDNRALNEWQN